MSPRWTGETDHSVFVQLDDIIQALIGAVLFVANLLNNLGICIANAPSVIFALLLILYLVNLLNQSLRWSTVTYIQE